MKRNESEPSSQHNRLDRKTRRNSRQEADYPPEITQVFFDIMTQKGLNNLQQIHKQTGIHRRKLEDMLHGGKMRPSTMVRFITRFNLTPEELEAITTPWITYIRSKPKTYNTWTQREISIVEQANLKAKKLLEEHKSK